jgi:mono/diheme cytochrome c family protein
MRYFLLILLLACVAVVSVAGLRGAKSRRPPLEIFPDMDRQLKLRPQTTDHLAPDGRSSRPYVPGTIPRGAPYQDTPAHTGRLPGTTNFVATLPVPVTPVLLERGRNRYTIYCSPCHGAVGDGNGITKKIGAMAVVASLHDPRIVQLPDGEIFHVIGYGKGLMQGYAGNLGIEDRWAIVAYVRALQLARLGTPEDAPAELRAQLK